MDTILKRKRVKLNITNYLYFIIFYIRLINIAGWSSLAARRAHNPKVAGSNPAPAKVRVIVYQVFFHNHVHLLNKQEYLYETKLMNKKIPLKSIVNNVSNEKGLSEEIIFDAIKDAILYATKKKYKMLNIEILIDKKTGIYKTFAIYKVISNFKHNISIKNSFKHIPIKYAKIYNSSIKINSEIKKELKSVTFGRIDAQIAKQIIIQKVKNAEKNIIITNLKKKLENCCTA